jgi:hypothetical protein
MTALPMEYVLRRALGVRACFTSSFGFFPPKARVTAGEISGNAPSATFFECVPLASATKIFSPRAYAILRCPGLTSAENATQRKIATMNCHAFGALTLGKRAFLIRRFRFFPSSDIR